MDGGNITVDLLLGKDTLTTGMRKSSAEIAAAKKQIREYNKTLTEYAAIQRRVPADIWKRSAARQQITEIRQQRDALMQLVEAERQYAAAAKQSASAGRSRGMFGNLGRGARLGIGGATGFIVGQNLSGLGGEGSFGSRAGGLLSGIATLNFVGAIKAAGEATRLTDEQINRLGTTSSLTSGQIDRFVASLNTIGQSDAATKLIEIRNEINALNSLNYFSASTLAFTNRPDDQAQRPSVGAVSRSNALVDSRKDPNRGFGLSLQLRTAIAAARTTPGKADEIAQLRRGERALRAQLGTVRTDEARLEIYTQIKSIQDEITSLTRKEKDKLKKRKRQVEQQLIALDPGTQVGQLGAGPFMSSDVFSFARSFGYKPKARDFLRDIREQNRQALAFERNLGKLGARGLPASVVGELRGQGIGAAEQVAALVGAPSGLLAQFGRAAATRQGVGERLQVAQLAANISRANIVVQNGSVAGIDRNGNGRLERSERFAIEAGARRR